jgi:hypothetical protein
VGEITSLILGKWMKRQLFTKAENRNKFLRLLGGKSIKKIFIPV